MIAEDEREVVDCGKDVGSMWFVELYLRMEIGGDVDCHLALEERGVADCCIILPS